MRDWWIFSSVAFWWISHFYDIIGNAYKVTILPFLMAHKKYVILKNKKTYEIKERISDDKIIVRDSGGNETEITKSDIKRENPLPEEIREFRKKRRFLDNL